MKYFLATLIIMITLPLVAQAEVRINEIAWMGVAGTSGSFGEWFELHNTGTESVDLGGWGLYKENGAKVIVMLTGSISADGYYVVERTTGTMPDPVPTSNDQAGPFSNSGFNNETGEYLLLKNSSDATVQTLNFSGGWPAGDSITKETMQWSGSAWVTAVATPGVANASPSSEEDEEVEEKVVVEESGDTEEEEEIVTTAPPRKRSPAKVYPKNDPHITITLPSTVYQGVSYEYTGYVALEHSEPKKGNFLWNMGDGTVVRTDTLSAVRHTYSYSGVYMVTLAYHNAPEYSRPLLQSSVSVTVREPSIALFMRTPTALQIKNTDNASIDLSGWLLYTPEGYAVFPAFTILAPKGNMSIPIDRIGLRTLSTATLKTPEGNTMAVLGNPAPTVQIVRSNYSTAPLLPLVVEASDPIVEDGLVAQEPFAPKQHHRTIVIGAVVFIVALLLLLERFMAQQE